METDLETERRAQVHMLRISHARLLRYSKAMLDCEELKGLEFGGKAWRATIQLGAAVMGAESVEKWNEEIVEKTSEAVKETT